MFRFAKRDEKKYETYPGLNYHAGQLSAYMAANNYFTIAIKGGSVVNFKPDDPAQFNNWLLKNNIRDINSGKPL